MRKLLSTYVDGACSPQQRRQVQEHLELCRDCAALLHELQRTAELVSGLPRKRTADGFMAALTPKLHALQQAPEPGLLRRALQWLADSHVRWQTAAAGALVLILAVTLFGVLRPSGEAPAPTTGITATTDYPSHLVELHRRYAATNLPFEDQALLCASYVNGM
jgi:anti-sigma factor RsiW